VFGAKENIAMRQLVLLSGAVFAVMVSPAVALEIDYNDGSYVYIPNGVILFLVLVFIASVVIGGVISSPSNAKEDNTTEAERARQYDDAAAHYRAMSRKLDAETDLAESLIKAKRTRAELDDIEAVFKDGKTQRRR
jgi:hypothetical protein